MSWARRSAPICSSSDPLDVDCWGECSSPMTRMRRSTGPRRRSRSHPPDMGRRRRRCGRWGSDTTARRRASMPWRWPARLPRRTKPSFRPSKRSTFPSATMRSSCARMTRWSRSSSPQRGSESPLGGVEPHAGHGEPAEELALYSRSVDLLVIGSRGYGPIGRVVHGSTAEKLARTARCPLLVLTRGATTRGAG